MVRKGVVGVYTRLTSYSQAISFQSGFTSEIKYEDIMPDRRKKHSLMYLFLMAYVGRHIQEGNQSLILSLLPKRRESPNTNLRTLNLAVAEFLGENILDLTDGE